MNTNYGLLKGKLSNNDLFKITDSPEQRATKNEQLGKALGVKGNRTPRDILIESKSPATLAEMSDPKKYADYAHDRRLRDAVDRMNKPITNEALANQGGKIYDSNLGWDFKKRNLNRARRNIWTIGQPRKSSNDTLNEINYADEITPELIDPEHKGLRLSDKDYNKINKKYQGAWEAIHSDNEYEDKVNAIAKALGKRKPIIEKAEEINNIAPELEAEKQGNDIKVKNGNTVEDALEKAIPEVKDTTKEDKTQEEEAKMANSITDNSQLPIRKVKPNSDPDSQRLGLNFTDEDRLNWNNGKDRRVGDYTLDEWNQQQQEKATPKGLLGHALKKNKVTPPSEKRPIKPFQDEALGMKDKTLEDRKNNLSDDFSSVDDLMNYLNEHYPERPVEQQLENLAEQHPEVAEKNSDIIPETAEEASQVNDGDKRTDEANNQEIAKDARDLEAYQNRIADDVLRGPSSESKGGPSLDELEFNLDEFNGQYAKDHPEQDIRDELTEEEKNDIDYKPTPDELKALNEANRAEWEVNGRPRNRDVLDQYQAPVEGPVEDPDIIDNSEFSDVGETGISDDELSNLYKEQPNDEDETLIGDSDAPMMDIEEMPPEEVEKMLKPLRDSLGKAQESVASAEDRYELAQQHYQDLPNERNRQELAKALRDLKDAKYLLDKRKSEYEEAFKNAGNYYQQAKPEEPKGFIKEVGPDPVQLPELGRSNAVNIHSFGGTGGTNLSTDLSMLSSHGRRGSRGPGMSMLGRSLGSGSVHSVPVARSHIDGKMHMDTPVSRASKAPIPPQENKITGVSRSGSNNNRPSTNGSMSSGPGMLYTKSRPLQNISSGLPTFQSGHSGSAVGIGDMPVIGPQGGGKKGVSILGPLEQLIQKLSMSNPEILQKIGIGQKYKHFDYKGIPLDQLDPNTLYSLYELLSKYAD